MLQPTQGLRTIGIVGTGFIARGFARLVLRSHPDLQIAAVLTRRPVDSVSFPCPEVLTTSIEALIDRCELIVECSGDAVHATDVVAQALQAGRPVVTMNAEFHVTTGSHFAGSDGYLTEAEGDQPGCLAALHAEAVAMGFEPVTYVNMKGYQNLMPSEADMAYWAARQDFTIAQTTSFTDGTKLQIEQAFIANATGSTIAQRALIGSREPDLHKVAALFGEIAERIGPFADYVIGGGLAPGVFIVARHDALESVPLRTIKMGDGPYYLLMRNYHLCALEIAKTVRRAFAGAPPLMTNSTSPTIGVAAVAKRDLAAGSTIACGIGSFEVRGEAVRIVDEPEHVPIGLLKDARLARLVTAGETLRWSDVELPDSLAVRLARNTTAPVATAATMPRQAAVPAA